MKLETYTNKNNTTSCKSLEVAKKYKNKVTYKQYRVLKHNTLYLEDSDEVLNKYCGCGCGWVEIDKEGRAVDLMYLDEDMTEWVRGGLAAIIKDNDMRLLALDNGQSEQNIGTLRFREDLLEPLILDNGNMRLLVNFSCYHLVRY